MQQIIDIFGNILCIAAMLALTLTCLAIAAGMARLLVDIFTKKNI